MEIYKNMMGRWRWVAKLVARLLATAGLWIRIKTSLKKYKIGGHKETNGQHTLARQKNIYKKIR
jgi:hypothetical protein